MITNKEKYRRFALEWLLEVIDSTRSSVTPMISCIDADDNVICIDLTSDTIQTISQFDGEVLVNCTPTREGEASSFFIGSMSVNKKAYQLFFDFVKNNNIDVCAEERVSIGPAQDSSIAIFFAMDTPLMYEEFSKAILEYEDALDALGGAVNQSGYHNVNIDGLEDLKHASFDLDSFAKLRGTYRSFATSYTVKPTSPPDVLKRYAERFYMAGGDISIYDSLGRRGERIGKSSKLEFLVDGLIPRGMITLIAGAHESGKSTLMTELAVATASPDVEATWLSFNLIGKGNEARGVAVMFTGEDNIAMLNSRLDRLDAHDLASNLAVIEPNGRSLDYLIRSIILMPDVELVIIDPLRRWLVGDEDSSANADAVFAQLEELARAKNCAVVIVHHLRKGNAPKSLGQMKASIRGSGVMVDRPRVVLGIIRDGRGTRIGVVKTNIPSEHMNFTEGMFQRDHDTMRHLRQDSGGEEAPQPWLSECILSALSKLNSEGERVHRTGRYELWEHRCSELSDVGRNRIRKEVEMLIKAGKITDTDKGLKVKE